MTVPISALQRQISAERVKAIYQQARMTSLNSWATGLLAIFIPNTSASPTVLYSWFIALTLSCILRLLVSSLFHRRKAAQKIALTDYSFWGYIYAASVLTTAMIWSSSIFILTDGNNAEYQLMLMMILVALCIGASHASTTYPLVGQVYNIPVMSSFIIACLIHGSTSFSIMAMLAFMFAIMMVVVGRDSDKRFREVQTLRFELAEKKEDAENANIAKSKFLAAASHDLRQPLHALTLFTGLLKDKNSYDDILQVVDHIDNSVDALQSLLNSLLDISKLDAGTVDINIDNIGITTILSPIENEFEVLAKNKGLEFYVEASKEHVLTDPNLLSRIIRNLVANAIYYTDTGSVLVLCKKSGEYLTIEIRDSGIGIPEQHQEDIFDEFVQLNNPERDRKKGLGLGLAIVKRLLLLLGYEMTFESSTETGTSFFIKVPISKTSAPKTPIKTSAATINLNLTDFNVMVIDDEPTIREGTAGLLTSWGCKVTSCANIEEALNNAQGNIPDVILADYRLQGNMNGIEAIEAVRETCGRDIDSAIITGDTAAELLKHAETSGHILLHKPVQAMQLRSYLTRLYNRQRKDVSA